MSKLLIAHGGAPTAVINASEPTMVPAESWLNAFMI